jgi:hypothetical protein
MGSKFATSGKKRLQIGDVLNAINQLFVLQAKTDALV